MIGTVFGVFVSRLLLRLLKKDGCMVERREWGEGTDGDADVCTQCKRPTDMMIVYGGESRIGTYCSFECRLRSYGISIEDDGIEKLLQGRLRGMTNAGAKTTE